MVSFGGVGNDLFELSCPFCDKHYKVPREKVLKHAGKSIHCRHCGKAFVVPAIPGPETQRAIEFDEPVPLKPATPTPVPMPVIDEPPTIAPPLENKTEVEETAAEQEGDYATTPPTVSDASEHDAPAGVDEVVAEETPSAGDDLGQGKAIDLAEDVSPGDSEPDDANDETAAGVNAELEAIPPAEARAPAMEMPVEPPPPPLAPPFEAKPRRRAKVTVSPVFDAQPEEEEPEAAKRGFSFGFGRKKGAEAETTAAPVTKAATTIGAAEVAAEPHAEPHEEEPASVEIPAMAEVETEPPPMKEIVPVSEPAARRALVRPTPAAEATQPSELTTIKRCLVLLSIMSVVCAVVLVAILLGVLGLLPHK